MDDAEIYGGVRSLGDGCCNLDEALRDINIFSATFLLKPGILGTEHFLRILNIELVLLQLIL